MKKIFSLMAAALMSVAMMAQKAQVWDFGAEQLDATSYDNMLSVAEINSWYPSSVTPGSSGNEIGDINASKGVNFKFVAGGKTNHRIRTTNTAITRKDEKSLKDAAGVVYSGYIYSNFTSTNQVYIEQAYEAGDKVEFIVGSNANPAVYEILAPDGSTQQFAYTAAAKAEKITYYVGITGNHRIYCTNEKLVVARIVRTPATYATVSGSITAPANIPSDYAIVFTNVQAGGVVETVPAEGAYSVQLAAGFDYNVSLKDANGFVVTSESPIHVAADMNYNVIL